MTTFTEHKQGTFSWMELSTKDSAQAKKFYGELFGWTFEDMPAGPGMTYTMCNLKGQHAAALFQMSDEMAKMVPVHWGAYVTVNDVDATTKKVEGAGGKVMKEPFDVMDVGRMSVIQDPSGASLSLWQAKKHIGAGILNEDNAMCWNECMTTNLDRAGKFYADVLGWKPKAHDMGPMGVYTLFKIEGRENGIGGMMGMPQEMQGVPSHWLNYVAVADVDASTKKATSLGATVMQPPTDIPNIGRFSVIQDPGGAVLGLYKNMH